MKPKINPVLRDLAPRLTEEEDQSLEQSLARDGQWIGFLLTVAPDGDICDGMNRFEKLSKQKIQPRFIVDKTLTTLEKKKEFVLRNNLARRHLNNWQRGQMAYKLLQLLDPQTSGYKAESVQKEVPGLKLRTFEKVITLEKNAPVSIIKKLDKGTLSVDTAYKIVTQKDRNLPKMPAPEGEWEVILADIPIAFENETIRGAAANHYPTMSVQELKAFCVPSAKNCIIFYWISPAVLIEGLEILQSWNFKYKTHFVWEKDKFGNGSWLRNQHEILIIGIKGNMPTPAKLFSSIIKAKRTEHSKKPELYDMIEEMYPKRKYLELFTRFKDTKKNWTFHGNEIDILEHDLTKQGKTIKETIKESKPKPIDVFKSTKKR